MTCSGLPANFLRSSGSCVATPTGQVFRWHLRIMMQPSATSGAVAKPNSSAPSSAPITTSRPVFIWPSACTLDRRPGRGARAAVMAGDHHVVGLALGDARGDGAHAHFGHQLDADGSV